MKNYLLLIEKSDSCERDNICITVKDCSFILPEIRKLDKNSWNVWYIIIRKVLLIEEVNE